MTGTPYPVFTILVVYLVFVLKAGPQLMNNKSPYVLKTLMRAYNIVQVLYNLYILVNNVSTSDTFYIDYKKNYTINQIETWLFNNIFVIKLTFERENIVQGAAKVSVPLQAVDRHCFSCTIISCQHNFLSNPASSLGLFCVSFFCTNEYMFWQCIYQLFVATISCVVVWLFGSKTEHYALHVPAFLNDNFVESIGKIFSNSTRNSISLAWSTVSANGIPAILDLRMFNLYLKFMFTWKWNY